MKILITGCNGQLGTSLQMVLPAANVTLIPLDRMQCDITNQKQVQEVFAKYHPQWVINAAAYTAVDKAETEQQQAYAINVNAVKVLAEECERNQAKLVHISTDYVFSGDSNKPYIETDICAPKSMYGHTKLLGEQIIQTTMDNYLILRVSWLFSAQGHNFLKTIVRLLQEKEYLRIVNDQYGCPTFSDHLAQVIKTLIQTHPALVGIFHYCDQPATTWHGFANSIQDYLLMRNKQAKKEIIGISTAEYPTPATRPAYSVLDCSKILATTGISPFDWHQGIHKIING